VAAVMGAEGAGPRPPPLAVSPPTPFDPRHCLPRAGSIRPPPNRMVASSQALPTLAGGRSAG
jgi:hypothetical protein